MSHRKLTRKLFLSLLTLPALFFIFFPSQAALSVPRTFATALLNSIKTASAVTIICILLEAWRHTR